MTDVGNDGSVSNAEEDARRRERRNSARDGLIHNILNGPAWQMPGRERDALSARIAQLKREKEADK